MRSKPRGLSILGGLLLLLAGGAAALRTAAAPGQQSGSPQRPATDEQAPAADEQAPAADEKAGAADGAASAQAASKPAALGKPAAASNPAALSKPASSKPAALGVRRGRPLQRSDIRPGRMRAVPRASAGGPLVQLGPTPSAGAAVERDRLLWDEPPPPPAPDIDLEAASLNERRAYVQSLSPQEQALLKQKRQRFEQLPGEEQQRLRQLHRQISQSPDAAQLQDTLRRYQQWLKTLPARRRAELLSMAPDERLEEMTSVMEDQKARRFAVLESALRPGDFNVLRRWMASYVNKHQDQLLSLLPPLVRSRLKQADATRRTRILAGWVLRDPKLPLKIESRDMETVRKNLSPSAQAALQKAGTRRSELVLKWLRTANSFSALTAAASAPVSDDQLRTFLEGLDQRERERLETLPPTELPALLRRMYNMRRNAASSLRPNAGRSPTPRPAPSSRSPATSSRK